ncbi:MAG: hypothetical protein JNL06_01055 [Alphaproteobacteria bacterium]|nr:hypothetical protein [Alphaproteobacteria bacterium]
MTLRIVAATTACIGFLIAATFAAADGMPEPEDENFNPVPSVPGKPAPGVTQPAPIKPAKPAPVVAPKPTPAPVVNTPEPAPPPAEPDDAEPAPAPAPAPTPTAATPAPAPATPPAPAPTSEQKKQIYEILSVDVQVSPKPAATITVKATARSGGWKDIELKPLQTFAAEVGMRSYTLVGTPPSGPSTQALSPVSVTITLDPLPADVKTIRVLGETNEVAQTFR